MMTFSHVTDPQEMEEIIAMTAPYLKKIERKKKTKSVSPATLLHAFKTGFYKMWSAKTEGKTVGFISTQVVDNPTGSRTLWVPYIIGRGLTLENSIEAVRVMADEAKAQGCTEIKAQARFGWLGNIKSHGFTPEAMIVSKEL